MALPGALAPFIKPPSPEVDNQLVGNGHRDGRANISALGEVSFEFLAYAGEGGLGESADRAFHAASLCRRTPKLNSDCSCTTGLAAPPCALLRPSTTL